MFSKPMDGLSEPNHKRRERGWKALAKKLYAEQPAFMKRGKGRFDGVVEYDSKADAITWDGKPLPETKLWKTNAPEKYLGKIVLCLMVKNESAIIKRMLNSCIDHFDGFIILDTGSTDGTQQIMWDFLEANNKKGAIYCSPFWDFSSCRTITVQLAHERGDFLLLMDADYKLVISGGCTGNEWISKLPKDLSTAPQELMIETEGGLAYSRPHIALGACRWQYCCRTHEYLSRSPSCKKPNTNRERFPYLKIDHVGDGGSKGDKVPRDIVLLLMDLEDNPKSDRAYFYLGNSLREMQMFDWSLSCYKMHMNLSGWNEEVYCSAKGALECLVGLKAPLDRQFALMFHGINQNPERLELLCKHAQRVRSNHNVWPYTSHLMSSILSLFTFNEYPAHQTLFVERWDHDVGFWNECSIAHYFNPVYFEVGAYVSAKMVAKKESVDQFMTDNNRRYQERIMDLRKLGLYVTKPIRKHLLENAHKEMAIGKFTKASELYELVLHNVVQRKHVRKEFWPTEEVSNMKFVSDHCDSITTDKYHQSSRLSAWKDAKCMLSTIGEADYDKALALYQMGLCKKQQGEFGFLEEKGLNIFVIAALFLDALKFVPNYAPALAALYEMTYMNVSSVTRGVLYMIRLVNSSESKLAAQTLLQPVQQKLIDLKEDQSLFVKVKKHKGNIEFCQVPGRHTCYREEFKKETTLTPAGGKPVIRSFSFA